MTQLGLDVIKALVLSIGIFSQFNENKLKDKEFSIEKLWQHSLKVAELTKRIAVAERAEKQVVDDCFLAGLMHEIGILILEDFRGIWQGQRTFEEPGYTTVPG